MTLATVLWMASAEKKFRQRIAARGVLVNSRQFQVTTRAAAVGTSTTLMAERSGVLGTEDTNVLTYPETLALADLLTS